MNALQMARTAYATTAPIRTPRNIEYDAFARITERLRQTSQRPGDRGGHIRALAENGRLWTLLAADVADAGNDLPVPLRARIFYLAEFTRTHTRKVMRGAASADALVEINLSVMRGLRSPDDAGARPGAEGGL